MDQEGISDCILHSHGWVQASQRILKNHLHALASKAQFFSPQLLKVSALQQYGTASQTIQTDQGAAQGAFATAGGTNHSKGFSGMKAKINSVN
jgi:hypothetical protein